MVQQLTRIQRLGLAAALALVVAAAAVPASADAAPRYRPDCQPGTVCLYQNVKWNHHHGLWSSDGGQRLDFLVDRHGVIISLQRGYILNPNRGDPYLPPDRWTVPGRSLVNRVSSYANYSKKTPYCVYDLNRDGEPILLWRMNPGSSSSWVGKRLNDRADTLWPCGFRLKEPGR